MSAAPRCFVESSALLRAVLGQSGAARVSDRLARAREIHLSRLTELECQRIVLRLRLAGELDEVALGSIEAELAGVLERAVVHAISEEVCALAGRIAPLHAIRSLDAIHLATWEVVRGFAPEIELLTADRRLAAAAGVEPLAD